MPENDFVWYLLLEEVLTMDLRYSEEKRKEPVRFDYEDDPSLAVPGRSPSATEAERLLP